MRLLLSGIDTIDCAYYLRPGVECRLDFAALSETREMLRAAKRREQATISLADKDFLLSPNGTASGYPYLMENPDTRIQFGEFNNPSFFVNYRSHALWHKSARALHIDFIAWAAAMRLDQVRDEGLSRVDFAFDLHLPSIDFNEDSFVILASKDATHRKDRKAQTFTFGQGDIVLRVYNKTAEIREASGKTWFYDLWGGVSENVWRIEFQVARRCSSASAFGHSETCSTVPVTVCATSCSSTPRCEFRRTTRTAHAGRCIRSGRCSRPTSRRCRRRASFARWTQTNACSNR